MKVFVATNILVCYYNSGDNHADEKDYSIGTDLQGNVFSDYVSGIKTW